MRGDKREIAVLVGGGEFSASADRPLVFGRADGDGVVGLDPNDMGISAQAGSVEFAWGVWWIVNRSQKRRLLVETETGRPPQEIGCGDRLAVTSTRVVILVPGAIYTHRVEVCVDAADVAALRLDPSPSSGTITFDDLRLSEKDRTALAALLRGYLRDFPHRDPRPLTYQEAARLLGEPWTRTTLRKQIERIKERLSRLGIVFDGARANDDLADHLISNGLLRPDDLALLPVVER